MDSTIRAVLALPKRLAALRGLHLTIARETGVGQATIWRIAKGTTPRPETAEKLLAWLKQADAEKRLKGFKAHRPKTKRTGAV